jgi:hypothetical protein
MTTLAGSRSYGREQAQPSVAEREELGGKGRREGAPHGCPLIVEAVWEGSEESDGGRGRECSDEEKRVCKLLDTGVFPFLRIRIIVRLARGGLGGEPPKSSALNG